MEELKTGYYRHYKGQHYQVIGVGRHSESKEAMVFYQALYGDFGLWARPLTMFCEHVEFEGKKQPRFQFIKSDEIKIR
jgi:hypothetical protein